MKATGRFLSHDPIRQKNNWYSYVDSSPLTGVDPLGLAKEKIRREECKKLQTEADTLKDRILSDKYPDEVHSPDCFALMNTVTEMVFKWDCPGGTMKYFDALVKCEETMKKKQYKKRFEEYQRNKNANSAKDLLEWIQKYQEFTKKYGRWRGYVDGGVNQDPVSDVLVFCAVVCGQAVCVKIWTKMEDKAVVEEAIRILQENAAKAAERCVKVGR